MAEKFGSGPYKGALGYLVFQFSHASVVDSVIRYSGSDWCRRITGCHKNLAVCNYIKKGAKHFTHDASDVYDLISNDDLFINFLPSIQQNNRENWSAFGVVS